MVTVHQGIILRASSTLKSSITVFDNSFGKIEAFPGYSRHLSHGALISYSLKKRGNAYFLDDIRLLEMPLEWARENFFFFHHMLELCDSFIPWDAHCEDLYALIYQVYCTPALVRTKNAQKDFLCHFFKQIGIYPEHISESSDRWLQACLENNPQIQNLRTAGFLRTLEAHE